MKTILTRSPDDAAAIIRRGGIVAFPTETVYGLGANVFDPTAIAKIFEAKKRPDDNPLIAHVADTEQIRFLAAEVTESAEKFISAFFPGPLTVILRKRPEVPEIATAGLDTIGIRMPRLDLAHRFLSSCETPVVAPSANISGRPSPTTWQAVAEDLDGRIDCILQGGIAEIGLESTVIDCTSDIPLVLRSGSISIEQLQAIIPVTSIYGATVTDLPRSPGLRHKHYSPRAKLIITDNVGEIGETRNAAYIGLHRPGAEFETAKICVSVEEYAHSIFEFFRECDRADMQTIYCERVDEKGIGVALMDRIRRAANG